MMIMLLDADVEPEHPKDWRPRRQAERSSATRAALVEGAVDEIAERGYGAFTIQKACRRAKVSTGAFQHYFETKIDLIEEIIAGFVPKAVEAISGDPGADLSVATRLRQVLDRCWALFDSKIAKVIWEIYICGRWEPRLRPVILDCAKAIQATWAQQFERALGRDLKPGSDPRALALFVMTQLRGAAVVSLVRDSPGDCESTVELLMDVMLSHCRPELQPT